MLNLMKCSTASLRHCLVLLLLFGLVFFFYNLNIVEIVTSWSPAQWVRDQSGILDAIYQSHRQSVLSSIPPKPQNPANRSVGAKDFNEAAVPATPGPQASPGPHASPGPQVSPGPYRVEYPSEYHFVMNEASKCQQEKPFVVLMVPVAPKNRVARDIIRSTWGGQPLVKGKAITLLFLLGLQVQEEEEEKLLTQESHEHRDLIQSDFIDCYKNLTIKTMVMLEWLDRHCSEAAYAMKVDSDMFLNVDNLVKLLLSAPQTSYMTGLIACHFPPRRNPESKWYLPVDVYPEETFPCYTLGLGYVFSLDLPKKLLEASRHIRALYIEDVYLGLCMRYLGIHYTRPPGWASFNVDPRPYSRQAFSWLVATTTRPDTDMVALWKDFKHL